jgi:hypothetical protein
MVGIGSVDRRWKVERRLARKLRVLGSFISNSTNC